MERSFAGVPALGQGISIPQEIAVVVLSGSAPGCLLEILAFERVDAATQIALQGVDLLRAQAVQHAREHGIADHARAFELLRAFRRQEQIGRSHV